MERIHESYQRRFRGDDFLNKILKGQDALGEPAPWVEEMLQDIKDGTALVLVASGIKIGETDAYYMTEFRIFYPRVPESVWKEHKVLKYFRELSTEEFDTMLCTNSSEWKPILSISDVETTRKMTAHSIEKLKYRDEHGHWPK